jgi:hypothetical protein
MPYKFEKSSALAIAPSQFWAHARFADVNAELRPWVHMTAPGAWKSRPLIEWPAGRQLFSSWVLLFGFLPVDLHFLCLERIDPERGFDERSSSFSNRFWQHSRSVVPCEGGCIVSDRVEYASRLPLLGAILLPVYRAIFDSRHRFLRRKYGRAADQQSIKT